ncbi:hypothetical protein RHMOL_Rhmol01G0101700 [Rhododendron molle]|uniref:Uncharacterized protein n=1 Tax=Rhododendron molle TaxID=49168 RepID=A0ACC0Q1Q9_RHOML|nr:hypothetical protein RHMOL_Rhmol01G0101700 [Rhododendron molle]
MGNVKALKFPPPLSADAKLSLTSADENSIALRLLTSAPAAAPRPSSRTRTPLDLHSPRRGFAYLNLGILTTSIIVLQSGSGNGSGSRGGGADDHRSVGAPSEAFRENYELKMVKEDRNAVPKHPCNGWIYFFQEQSKMTKKSSSKRMSMSEIREKWKALGDKAKQKYTEKAKLSSEEYKEQKVKVDPQEDSKETFTTRTQLKTTCDIICNLEPQQVESVKAMGFGGLLRLKCTRLDRKLCEQLLFYFEHCTPAKDFISPCACRPSPRLVQWGNEEIRDRIHWLDQSSSQKLKIIVEDGVGKRVRAVDKGKEIGQNIPMERFQGIEELNGILKKLVGIMETMDVRGKKTNENSLAAKVRMDMKDTSSPVVNEKKGTKAPSFDSSTSPLTNKEKDSKEQSSGHFTSPLKANQEENTKKPSLSHLTSPLKTNKEQDMKEPKINPSLKRPRRMATNIADIMSSTAPPTIGMNKRQKKCKQEMARTKLKESQPVKKNAKEKPTMECQQEMPRTRLRESQPVKKNVYEKPTIGMVRELILRFVFDTTLSVREQLCNLGISYATRSDFMSLRKNGWVVGETYALNGGINSRTWVKHFGGSTRYTGFLESVERVYIPINDNNIHWFMCVVNFKHANVYVLDSLPSLSKPKVQNEKVLRVLEYLVDVIQHLGNNGSVMKAHKLPIKRPKWLPVQEPGSDDCGVHTAKYFDLEQFNEEEAANLRFTSEEGRNKLILDLILCGENEIRNDVIRKAQEKYRNTRRM